MSGVPCIHDTMIKKTPQCLGKTNKFRNSNTNMRKKTNTNKQPQCLGKTNMIKKTNTNKFKNKKKDNETQRIKHIASNCSLGSRSKMNTEKCFSLSHHMFDSLINASMNDICLHTHTHTGSSSLHLCVIGTF